MESLQITKNIIKILASRLQTALSAKHELSEIRLTKKISLFFFLPMFSTCLCLSSCHPSLINCSRHLLLCACFFHFIFQQPRCCHYPKRILVPPLYPALNVSTCHVGGTSAAAHHASAASPAPGPQLLPRLPLCHCCASVPPSLSSRSLLKPPPGASPPSLFPRFCSLMHVSLLRRCCACYDCTSSLPPQASLLLWAS